MKTNNNVTINKDYLREIIKKAGHAISTTIITVTNRDGTRSNVARYTLVDGDNRGGTQCA